MVISLDVMKIKSLIKRVTPKPVVNLARYHIERRSLGKTPRLSADFGRLKRVDRTELSRLFDSELIEAEWNEVEAQLKRFGLWNPPGGTGGPDLRALYYLLRHYGASTVLEVGTHLGCSVATIAMALARRRGREWPGLVTVDIADVNDRSRGPWRGVGLRYSPKDVIFDLKLGFEVEFVQSDSVDYLRNTDRRFDWVFLDGDHAAETVYREISLASRVLRPDGSIALHDFSPNRIFQQYYEGWTIPGPFLAARRISDEQADVDVIALGKLPWMRGRNLSLLALLGHS
jgi:predicted O-methyltransferase YrrM